MGALASWPLAAQAPAASPCANTPAYTPCDLVFELSEKDAAAHPSPYTGVDLRVEFRSPRHRTYPMPGFWDGGRRMVVRFAPVEAGDWEYLVASNIAEWNGRTGAFTAAASDAPGFIRAANLHHWAYTQRASSGLDVAHLWMGATEMRFASLDDAAFRSVADARAAQKFNHLRGMVSGDGPDAPFQGPDSPNPAFFQQLDGRVRYLNGKGIVADLILAHDPDALIRSFPTPDQRRRFVRYLVARYAPMNVTWQAAAEFEGRFGARSLLKEIGGVLKQSDPYGHPRTSGARITSAPLLDDGWMDFAAYGTPDDQIGAVEHQLYGVPFVNQEFAREDSGAGKSGPHDVDAATLRRRLWNAAMDGQYVTYANTGSGPQYANSPGAKQMTVWFDFFSGTRHWELEPYFDVDGGRALALEDTEYVVYIEKPGPLELVVVKHGYDVFWIDPATGESVKAKRFSGDHFTGEAPDPSHDWVLHVVREGRMESMNRSYKFDSRENPLALQEIETSLQKTPFAIDQPSGDLAIGRPAPYAAKITRATRATRSMSWVWTGEVPAEGQGFRVLSSGAQGTFEPPAELARNYPAVLLVRLYGMNANGKVYTIDKAFQLDK
jgi:hypothetical protein